MTLFSQVRRSMMIAILLAAGAAQAQAPRFSPHPEKLYGYGFDQGGITFQVYSGGCTNKNNFRLAVADQGAVRQVVLYRIIPDYCLALFPFGVPVRYETRELGLRRGQPLQVLNPFREFNAPGEEP